MAAAAAAAVYPACDGTSCECHRLADEVTVVVYVEGIEKKEGYFRAMKDTDHMERHTHTHKYI